MYHTRDLAGNDIPASAVVIAPATPAPSGGRTVVSWGHPTTGAATKCGPSLGFDPLLGIEGMDALLELGYVIAATDYPGMSVPGPSSYLIGATEGNSMLDAVRAAQAIPETGAGSDVLLWGHSQGGHAALFAAQRAGEYAPELGLIGVAVAAPAADLTTLLSDDIGDHSGVAIASYACEAYELADADRFSKDSMQAILTSTGKEVSPQIAQLCLLTQNDQVRALADPVVDDFVTADPSTTEPWKTMIAENSAGGAPITVPVFVGQGLADELVVPSSTQEYVAALCAAGTAVDFHEFDGITHLLAAYASLLPMLRWLGAVERGEASSNCP
jgi:pimeloyl-ACP methyl ester carboxylesterase